MMTTSLINMTRRAALLTLVGAGAAACETADIEKYTRVANEVLGSSGGASGLTQANAAAGIKTALKNGVTSAVNIVGRSGGFLDDGKIKIPLPRTLQDIQSTLAKVGMSGTLDNLETQINRGAEKAAPVAKNIFVNAVTSMSIEDAIGIVRGGNNAATNFLQQKTTPKLTGLFRPIMSNALQQAGAIRSFDSLASSLRNVPLAPKLGADAKNDLIDHGVGKGLDGVFYYIAKEEAAIRSDPAKRTSEILRQVFG